jgi:hypothetical protein
MSGAVKGDEKKKKDKENKIACINFYRIKQ